MTRLNVWADKKRNISNFKESNDYLHVIKNDMMYGYTNLIIKQNGDVSESNSHTVLVYKYIIKSKQ